jgi:hypothetical protein
VAGGYDVCGWPSTPDFPNGFLKSAVSNQNVLGNPHLAIGLEVN